VSKEFERRIPRKIRLTAVLLFLIGLILLISTLKNFLLIFALFIFCFVFMFKWGQFIFLDLDPVPFSAILLLYLYDYKIAIQFVFLAQLSIDLVSSRLNHFSIINLLSIVITIFVFSIPPFKPIAIYFAIVVFNVFRSILNQFFGLGLQTLMFNMAHACVYFVLGSLIGFFI
jgi:hypothetical protein